jgi:hypothetical protein
MLWIAAILIYAAGFATCWGLFQFRILGVEPKKPAKKKATKKTGHNVDPRRTKRGPR